MEVSSISTRRQAACGLIKILSQNFRATVLQIFCQHLEALLHKYSENPVQNWRIKETAIFLVTSLVSRNSTQKRDATELSHLVSLQIFCDQHIIPELDRLNVNEFPVLKANAIKFVMSFRTLLSPQTMTACMPNLVRHLKSESQVVFSYAACAIVSVFKMRASQMAVTQPNTIACCAVVPFAGKSMATRMYVAADILHMRTFVSLFNLKAILNFC